MPFVFLRHLWQQRVGSAFGPVVGAEIAPLSLSLYM